MPEQIKDEELEILIESAIYAPTGHNDQPWHFTIIQNKELIDEMSDVCKNIMADLPVEWIAKMGKAENLHIFYNAPTVIIVSGMEDAVAPFADCCASIQNMILAAESINIGSCWIGLVRFFFEDEGNIGKLGIPEGYKPYYAVALGYKGSDKNKAPERNRDVVNYIK